jgi:cell wall-associated NlpC family hydrolase
VPRDTDMQCAAIGEAATIGDAAALRRGDLLYLPGHVLIYAGEGGVIHADGDSMTVRRDALAGWMRARGLDFSGLIVRRA